MTTATNLQVLLAHFEGEMTMTPRNAQWVNVASVEDAAEKVNAYRAEHGCGGRDWFGGIVRDGKKKPVAVVSIIGRIGTVEEYAQFISNAKRLMSKK